MANTINDKRKKTDKAEDSNKDCAKQDKLTIKEKGLSFTKYIVIAILCVAELLVCASYILAFLGKEAIAESLSSQIVITIIGTVTGYFVKSLIENIFKNNHIFKSKTEEQEELSAMEDNIVDRVVQRTGGDENSDEEILRDDEIYG